LEEHHPDKVNHPTETIDLCANCHSEIHRKKPRPRKKEREQNAPTLTNPSLAAVSIPTPPTLSGPQQNGCGLAQSTNYVPELPINPDTLRLGLALYSMDLGRQGLRDALRPRQGPNGSASQEQSLSLDNFLSRVIDGGAATFFLWLGAKLFTSYGGVAEARFHKGRLVNNTLGTREKERCGYLGGYVSWAEFLN